MRREYVLTKDSDGHIEVTNIFNIYPPGFLDHDECGCEDDDFDPLDSEEPFEDNDDPCEGCPMNDSYDDEDDGDEAFDPEEELVKRLINVKDHWMDVDFKPSNTPFDYLSDDPSDDDLAQEIGRITHIGSLAAFMVLKAQEIIDIAAEEFYLDRPAMATAVSFLTGIEEETVIEVLVAMDIIFNLISIRMEEAGINSKGAKNAQKGAAHER